MQDAAASEKPTPKSPPPSYPEPPYPYEEPDGLDIRDLLAILKRRRRIIVSTVVLITAIATLIGLQITPKYTATALIMIDPRKERIVNVEEVLQGLNPDAAVVETQIKVLASRDHAERVMAALRLFDDPEFIPERPGKGQDLVFRIDGPVAKVLSLLPRDFLIATRIAEEPIVQLEVEDPWQVREAAIEAFRDKLKVRQEGRSYVIAVSFTSVDPRKAARIANAVAQLYVDEQREAKVEATREASSWLAQRLEALRQEVERAEKAVEEYRAQYELVAVGGSSIKEQELLQLNRELSDARADLAEREAVLARVRELQRRGEGLDAVADVIQSPVIINLREQEALLVKEEAELRTYYGEKHPKMRNLLLEKEQLNEKIAREVKRIIRNLENDVAVARARVRELTSQLEALTAETEGQRAKLVKLNELEREAQAARQLYETFLQRFMETREQADIVKSDVRIVSRAAPPESPSTPGPKLFAAVGFTASTMLGVLLALLRERLDSGLRSARDIERVLGLPTFGLVPRLEKLKKGQRPHEYLLQKPLSAYAEAIRSVFTSLQLSDVDEPPKVVLITSSIPEEGKTTLAVSLATFAAQSSQKTLLVDLDLRHPNIQREFGFLPEAGFVEYMAGERRLEEVIRRDERTGVDCLPIRRQAPNPTDLLGSRRMREMIQELRRFYDFIVIDSAPVLGVTDSRVIARVVDKVLFAVRWEKTDDKTAANALDALREARADVAGAVLTLVDVKKHAQYGYGDVGQYYGKYKRYYVE